MTCQMEFDSQIKVHNLGTVSKNYKEKHLVVIQEKSTMGSRRHEIALEYLKTLCFNERFILTLIKAVL